MVGMKRLVKKGLGEMGFTKGGGNINWFPGHMAAATRAIRDRLKLADLVIEVRDSRVRPLPLSHTHHYDKFYALPVCLNFLYILIVDRYHCPLRTKTFSLCSLGNAVS